MQVSGLLRGALCFSTPETCPGLFLLRWHTALSTVILSRHNVCCRNDFRLEVDWVKALPGGSEADFVLVSCVGAGLTGETRRKMISAKRYGLSHALLVTAFSAKQLPLPFRLKAIDTGLLLPSTAEAWLRHRCLTSAGASPALLAHQLHAKCWPREAALARPLCVQKFSGLHGCRRWHYLSSRKLPSSMAAASLPTP